MYAYVYCTSYDKRITPIDFQGQGSKVSLSWGLSAKLINMI